MKRLLAALALLAASAIPILARNDEPPKLVLLISVDQFRYDYLTRFGAEYDGGLARLMSEGAVFTNAYLDHFPTVTAIGHATMLTGATPALHGIVGNSWFDRVTNREITSVSDETVPLVGASGTGSSPRNLLVSTIADELKRSGRAPSKAIGISMKDRGAILTVGRRADAAYWYDIKTGDFISSRYYFPDLPDWVKRFNNGNRAEKHVGKRWGPADGEPFLELPSEVTNQYFSDLRLTPYGNELVVEFFEEAIRGERLGRNPGTDVLAVSLSSNDYAGHRWGPDSPQVRDIAIQTDKALARLLSFVDSAVGLDRTLVVFTADHGVAPVPELMNQQRMPGGRMSDKDIADAVDRRLDEKYGEEDWVIGQSGPLPYLDHSLIRGKGLDLAEVRAEAAAAVRNVPHVLRVYTYDQLAAGRAAADHIDRRVLNGFHPVRGADLFVVLEPYWMFTASGTTHGTPHHYDAHVPLIFMGFGIRPGRNHASVAVNDIAPTVAAILGIETPSGSTGRVLDEALATE